MGIDVEKMEARGDIKGLIKALKDKDETVRGKAAISVDKMGWKPSDDTERAYYLAAKRQWDELTKLGKPAVEPLILCLQGEEVDVLVNAARALGELGDVKAIKQLSFCVISIEAVLMGQMDWHRYDSLVPVVAEALTSIGEPAIELLIKYLKDDSLISGIPTLWALCDIGNRKATETVINWIFSVGPTAPIAPGSFGTPLTYQKEFLSPPDLIRKFIPPNVLPKLLGDYTDLILDIFAWELASYSEDTSQLQLYMSRCSKAVQQLCEIRTPISSNILHKILKIEELDVTFHHDSIQKTWESLDFKGNQQMAKDELRQRGNPRYDPSAYLDERAWKL